MKYFLSSILYTFIAFFGFFMPISAQNFGDITDFSIIINPQVPRTNQNVAIEIESLITNIDKANIRWIIDGSTQLQGRGATNITITTGGIGETTSIIAIIDTLEGGHFEKRTSIRPVGLDIVWEANTYTPPFYKGRALPTSNSTIIFTALPQFSTNGTTIIDPENLVYTWKSGLGTLSQSGFGKQSITLQGPQRSQTKLVTVEVSSLNNSLQGKKTILVETQDPEIIFYRKDPILGIDYTQALGRNVELKEEEQTFRVEPFYFSKEDFNTTLDFDWTLNGREFTPNISRQEATFRQTEKGGTARVGVSVFNINKILQDARKTISINFGLGGGNSFGSPETSPFGF